MGDYIIRVENSAPSQSQPAKSVSWAASLLGDLKVHSVADIGCGRLRNLPVLIRNFSKIMLIDTELQCNRIKSDVPHSKEVLLQSTDQFEKSSERFDAAFLISVLHIMPSRQRRFRLLETAFRKIKLGGFLVVDVPTGENYYLRRCGRHNAFRDGYLMGKSGTRTFYKLFSAKELDALVGGSANFHLIEVGSVDKHLCRIWLRGEG